MRVSFKGSFFLLFGFVLGVTLTIYWNNLPQFLTGAGEHLLTIFHQLAYYLGAALLILSPFYLYYRFKYGKDWASKAGIKLVAGKGLMASTKKLVNEVQTRQLQTDTVVEVGVNIFWRFTRIGLIGLSLAIIPIWLLVNQNELLKQQNQKFDIQNERINLQNNLVEADRRGSLVLLMSNIIDQVNAEIEKQKPKNPEADTLPYKLSDPLIGRIAALSQSLLPYRYLVGDSLSQQEVSFERGQLLLALVNSNLDSNSMDNIFLKTDFSFSYLSGADLQSAYLSRINLKGADLSNANLYFSDLRWATLDDAYLCNAKLFRANLNMAFLDGANLDSSNISYSTMNEASLSNASLVKADLSFSSLAKLYLRNTNLYAADLTSTNLSDANLFRTNLTGANLNNAKLTRASMKHSIMLEANLSEANLEEIKFIELEQLISTLTLFNCKGIEKFESNLKKEKPCLLDPPKESEYGRILMIYPCRE